ncbi:DNA polymerase III subunit delta [candidate division KSB1 bacterium]
MNYKDTISRIKNDDAYSIYVVTGEEEYLREKAIDAIINRFLDKNTIDFNLDVLRGEEVEWGVLYNRLFSIPMLSDKRVIYIKEGNLLAKTVKDSLEKKYISNPVDSSVLIIELKESDLRQKFFSALKKNSCWCEFKKIYENQLPSWIVRYAKSKDKEIDRDAIDALIELCSSGLRDILNEMDKILLFIGEKKLISKSDIIEIAGSSKEYNIFELLDTIGLKDINRSLKIIYKMLERGDEITPIIRMMTRHMKILLEVKELESSHNQNEIAKKIGIKPFFMKNYIKQSKLFSVPEIENCFSNLLSVDILAKSGMRNKKLLMDLLVSQLINSVHPKEMKKLQKYEVFRELLDVYLVI